MGGKIMKISSDTKLKIRFIYGVVTSVSLVILGTLLIWKCYGIYTSGANPFTRESVGEALMSILVPIILSALLVVGGFVLHIALPTEKEGAKAYVTNEVMEQRLIRGRDMLADASTVSAIERERNLRSFAKLINISIFIVGLVLVSLYAFNPNNYTDDLNKSVIDLSVAIVIPLLPTLLVAAARLVIEPLSYKREIELLKSLPKADMSAPVSQKTGFFARISDFFSKNESQITTGVRIAILLAGVVYVVLGIFNGGMGDVLAKAIKICTECIGLG